MRALVLGGASWNLMVHLERFPAPVPATLFASSSHETVGSSGAGKALNLRRLGWEVTLWAALGRDEPGDRVRSRFAAEQIELVDVVDPAGTMRHVNLMDAAGERISIFVNSGSPDLAVDHQVMGPAMSEADLASVTIFDHCRGFLPVARRRGVPLWVDVHDYDGVNPYHREFVEAATWLQLSTVTGVDWRRLAETRVEAGTELVLCTHGARGASVLTAAGWDTIEVEPVEPIDTNGAGDAFFAGFTTSWFVSRHPGSALRAGASAARAAVLSWELAPTAP